MKLLSSLVIAFGLLNSARADTPAKPDAATQAKIDKFLKIFDSLVDAMVKDGTDCVKGAADIVAIADANKEAFDDAAKARAAGKKLPQEAIDHMTAGIQKMMPMMRACTKDQKFMAALGRIKPTDDSKGKKP